jgi:hypothetical protein
VIIEVNFRERQRVTPKTPVTPGDIILARDKKARRQLNYALEALVKKIRDCQYYGGTALFAKSEYGILELVVWSLGLMSSYEIFVTHDGQLIIFQDTEDPDKFKLIYLDPNEVELPETLVMMVDDLSRRISNAQEVIVDTAEDQEEE